MNRLGTARLSPTLLHVASILSATMVFASVAAAQAPTKPPVASPPGASAPPAKPASADPAAAKAGPSSTTSTANGEVASAAKCTVTLDGDGLRVEPAPVTVQASLSSAIGDSVTASFPIDSKINVVSVSPGIGNSLRMVINTADAAPGSWRVTLRGSKGDCTGTVKVAPQH